MNQKTFFSVSGFIFAVVAVVHAAKLVFHWEAVVGGWAVPMYVSIIGLAVAGYLAYAACRLSRG